MTTSTKLNQVANCEWIDERWHLDGRGIHAGAVLEMKLGDGWHEVGIESRNRGEILDAYIHVGGRSFKTQLRAYDQLRWPHA